jgi:hypothetical protein
MSSTSIDQRGEDKQRPPECALQAGHTRPLADVQQDLLVSRNA